MKIIHTLRQKSDTAKHMTALVASALVTLVVFMIWFSTWQGPITSTSTPNNSVQAVNPLSNLAGAFVATISNIGSSVNGFKNSFKSNNVPDSGATTVVGLPESSGKDAVILDSNSQ